MQSTKPFQINVAQPVLDDLRWRLEHTRWPDQVRGADWDYGTNLDYLKGLVQYWARTFDWRKQEAFLNGFNQFTVDIDGLTVHAIQERGKGPNPLPILLLHGWPDSFFRMHKIIPLLTDPARFGGDPADSFDVIVPSLPGFGFTQCPTGTGGNIKYAADLMAKLMRDVLGYPQFASHGGDGGSPMSQCLALAYPDSVVGIHLTDIGWASQGIDPATLSEKEKQYLSAVGAYWAQEGAYAALHSSKPQTLAYGLNDSPVGLAAWIIEKFRTWSDCDGDLERIYTKDELLTNITIYWVTQTINSSMRGYYEETHNPSMKPGYRIETPVGMALFPKDYPPPRELAERSLNIQHWTEMPRGGHFAALEAPELLTDDLRAFFRPLRPRP